MKVIRGVKDIAVTFQSPNDVLTFRFGRDECGGVDGEAVITCLTRRLETAREFDTGLLGRFCKDTHE